MSPSIMICPATCELCGQWMPGHSKDCPRSGVHPSQWSFNNNNKIETSFVLVETDMQEDFNAEKVEFYHDGSPTRNNNNIMIDADNF